MGKQINNYLILIILICEFVLGYSTNKPTSHRSDLFLFWGSLLGSLGGFACTLGSSTSQFLVGTGHTDSLENRVLLFFVGDGSWCVHFSEEEVLSDWKLSGLSGAGTLFGG